MEIYMKSGFQPFLRRSIYMLLPLFLTLSCGNVTLAKWSGQKSVPHDNSLNPAVAGFPDQFSLDQNFPDPFNPSTSIKWYVPLGGKQTLKIFDILDKEIEMLVSEYKPAGHFNAKFTAKGLGRDSEQLLPSDREMILLK